MAVRVNVKLLVDEQLSRYLVDDLGDLFAAVDHLTDFSLLQSPDSDIWQFARDHDYLIVTKDSDYSDLSNLHGCPPKVLWIRVGNCTTAQIAQIIRENIREIESFCNDPAAAMLELL